MTDEDRCDEELWDIRCDKAQGHQAAHRGQKNGSRVMWGSPIGTEPNDRDEQELTNHQHTCAAQQPTEPCRDQMMRVARAGAGRSGAQPI